MRCWSPAARAGRCCTRSSGPEPALPELLARMAPVDLVLVEGFKSHPFPKLEVHRPALGKPPIWPEQPDIVAVAADAPIECDRTLLPLERSAPDCGLGAWRIRENSFMTHGRLSATHGTGHIPPRLAPSGPSIRRSVPVGAYP